MVKKEDQSSVRFSVKELLTTIQQSITNLGLETNRKIDNVAIQLQAKSDKPQVDKLEQEFQTMKENGCGASRMALNAANELKTRVDKLEDEGISAKVTEGMSAQIKSSRLQWGALIATWLLFFAAFAALFQHNK